MEFRSVHATVAKNLPLDKVNAAAVQELLGATDTSNPLYVICKSGGRSRKACEALTAAGVTSIVNVEGGTDAWARCGLPVERGGYSITVDGQVRIIMGSLVILSVILSRTVDPNWIWLSAFIGAALIFVGLTNWCGLALVIAKMPWNQRT
jgi:rhodanese-related sulfurtransferase